MQERLLMRERRNRLIRWLIIAVSVMILFPLYYPSPWSPKTAVRQTLEGMALPSDTIEVVSMIQTGSMYSVLFYDEEHELYHHFFMDRPFGVLWRNSGGGGGYTFDPNEILKMSWGGQREDDNWYSYAVDQVNDPRIRTLTVEWSDGVKQSMQPIKGLYHFARVFGKDEKAAAVLLAYDAEGKLIYRLDENQPAIRKQ
ncbi:hypothetical protein [Brevibacillus borstelensis]|uniref:hypothetical protein n=1 Tax=Brevibacillus borstelensis TaxID=45462 RepID=UPI00203DF796|nr:hypothetical protein [Brevibacillus borstelensis]MCM3472584.1 hypothetical protein [Brevibacillus borstelensis]MCM3561846.1 hypothetical protein [Brevibacillus borstelensis]MCM3625554.1 hypothetical protein [Brevibacillus borstelensis]MED1855047.1 hypothetical protein [Brevibacillus borstelensis]